MAKMKATKDNYETLVRNARRETKKALKQWELPKEYTQEHEVHVCVSKRVSYTQTFELVLGAGGDRRYTDGVTKIEIWDGQKWSGQRLKEGRLRFNAIKGYDTAQLVVVTEEFRSELIKETNPPAPWTKFTIYTDGVKLPKSARLAAV